MKLSHLLVSSLIAITCLSQIVPAHAETEPPLVGDMLIPPPPMRITRSIDTAPDRYSPSAFLAGHVAVQLVFVESNGQHQASSENWSEARRAAVTANVQAALDWWEARLPNAGLSIDLFITKATTGYEPITLTLNDEKLWAGEALASLGFTGSNYFEQAYSADEALRNAQHTNWATTIFVVDSENDPDGRFADGQFAYAYVGGPFLVVTSDAATYGTSRLAPVVAHEFGHIFGALDQYEAAATPCTIKSGYLGIANTNSQFRNCGTKNPSIMWEPLSAFQSNAVDASALGQLGYHDDDADTIPDPLDTVPTLDAQISQTNGMRPRLVADAADQPFPSAFQRNITINTIARIEQRIDGGAWSVLPAADGAYNSTNEHIDTLLPLYDGTHTVELRAINRVGAASPVVMQQVTVSGVGPQPNVNITAPTLQNTTTTIIRVEAPAGFELRAGETPDLAGSTWQAVETQNTIELAPTDGEHILYIGVRDPQGLEMPVVEHRLMLDRAAPTGSALLENAPAQTLVVHAEDAGSGVEAMTIVDANGIIGPWQTFSSSIALPINISPTAIRLRDRAGNVSVPLAVLRSNEVYIPVAVR